MTLNTWKSSRQPMQLLLLLALQLRERSLRPSVRLSCANTCYQGRCRRAGSQLIRNSSPLYGTFRCARWHGPACRAVPGRPAVAHDICTVHCASCVRIILAHRTRLTRTRPDLAWQPAGYQCIVYQCPLKSQFYQPCKSGEDRFGRFWDNGSERNL